MKKILNKQRTINRSIRKTTGQKSNKLVAGHFRIAKYKDTGRLIHYKQTSHFILIVMLAIVGIFIYYVKEFSEEQTTVLGSSTVSITAVVPETVSSDTSSGSSTVTIPTDISDNSPSTENGKQNDYTFWLNASIPVYYVVLALTLGFWVGDLFDRKFGVNKSRQKIRRAA